MHLALCNVTVSLTVLPHCYNDTRFMSKQFYFIFFPPSEIISLRNNRAVNVEMICGKSYEQ